MLTTWSIQDREYLNFLYSNPLTPEEVLTVVYTFFLHLCQDYFLRLRHHHRNLLGLPFEEKQTLVPSFEGQLSTLVNEIVFLRRLPEFKDVNEIANMLLQPVRSNKRRRLNNGHHLATGQPDRGEEEDEVISQRMIDMNVKSFESGGSFD